ncbi:hypothetical protein ACH4L9_34875 [Streptomyces globisporus]
MRGRVGGGRPRHTTDFTALLVVRAGTAKSVSVGGVWQGSSPFMKFIEGA